MIYALRLCIVLAGMWLGSCAHSRTHGSFITRPHPWLEEDLAADAARGLERLYPPANTTMLMVEPQDTFGNQLVSLLRERGFAVASTSNPAARQVELEYVVDELGDLVRVTLLLTSGPNTLALARAYAVTTQGVQPAGAWARQVNSQ